MRFLKCGVVTIAALEATLANAACRNTDIFMIDAIVRGMCLLSHCHKHSC